MFEQIWTFQSRLMIFQTFIEFLYVAISGGTLPYCVMSQQYNSPMEQYAKCHKISLFMKIHLPCTFILRYDRAKMIVNVFIWMNPLKWSIDIPQNEGGKWKSMYMYKLIGEVYFCGISDTVRVAIWRGQHRDFNKTLQNHNSLMDYSIFLKLLLIDFLNCFPFIQFTLIFGGTAPLSVNRTFCFSVRTSLQNMHGNVWGSFTVCNTHWILFETKFCIQS